MGGDAHSHLRDAEIYRDIAAHFTEKEMVDLTIAIGLMNVFNRIATGFGCDPASS
jgi:alkylhydroperoxidase family enzyme